MHILQFTFNLFVFKMSMDISDNTIWKFILYICCLFLHEKVKHLKYCCNSLKKIPYMKFEELNRMINLIIENENMKSQLIYMS